ncbi:Hint domain-containing protein [Patescibacteria group bacterium]
MEPDGSGCHINCGGDSCFVSGTKVTMEDGSEKSIEDVQVGDKIQSMDVKSGEIGISQVNETEDPVREGYFEVRLKGDDETLRVTNEHPLYSIQKGNSPNSFWESLKAFLKVDLLKNILK